MSPSKKEKKTPSLKAGVIIVAIQITLRFIIPGVIPSAAAVGVLGGLFLGLVFLVWWAFFSKAPKIERWGGAVLMIAALIVTSQFIHDSIGTGMRGMMFASYAIPVLCLTFMIWALATRRLAIKVRRVLMVFSILLSCGAWALVRSEGITGGSVADFSWRWAETHEERLLSMGKAEQAPGSTITASTVAKAEWPGFRGPGRDGIARGTSIPTDWTTSPPRELWRNPIGPGCSSIAICGNLLYTQEQLGEDEMVSCYNLMTGETVWKHRDLARFWDSHAGAGPRSTPTLANNHVYTCGATGILNVLNALDGSVVWTRNAASDMGAEVPEWGFTSSPQVVGNVFIIALAGTLAAYDISTGDLLWRAGDGGTGYSSPHLATLDGTDQIIFMNDKGAISLNPGDGTTLWEYPWPHTDRILQPVQTPEGDIILSTGGSKGLCRLKVTNGPAGWDIEERWNTVVLKSFFNDFVIHKNHAYGFSGPFLECVNLTDGSRQWKGGRYGGQLILLADQDLLIILTEKGEVALVGANPEQYTELAKIPAIEGKTWNHPVMVTDKLLVRNSVEMVAYHWE